MRLLIVEDEKQICDMVAKSLYHAGYEVDTCYDGGEALECILSENYDLIVLDLNLPGMAMGIPGLYPRPEAYQYQG